jgi:amidase
MPSGTISSSADTVGVAVVNYQVPVVETKEQVLDNCRRMAQFVDGIKRGYPGCDLVIFPEYSTQGFHPTKWRDLTTTCPGPETAVFSDACRRNKVWGVFSLTGEENQKGNPFNTFLLINDKGDIVLKYHKILPWVPMEPWFPGDETMVAEGPKGLKIGAIICYDGNHPEIVRDTVMKGAELVVRIQGYMYPAKEQQRMIAQVRAWENLTYFAVANMAGRDLVYSYFGHSCIIDFDGSVIAECGTAPDEVQYGLLSLSAIRDARKNWTAENHLYNTLHRGYTALPPDGVAECPYEFYKLWVNSPMEAKRRVEALTRPTALPQEAPIPVPAS